MCHRTLKSELQKSTLLRRAVFGSILMLLFSCQTLLGQTRDGGVLEGSSSFESELKGKYKIESIRLPDSAGRLRGPFHITGDLTPRNLVGKTTVTNTEETVLAFLEEMRTLFGVADLSKELRKKSVVKDRHGATHISYHREVAGLPLEGMEVTTHLDSEGKIFAVTGHLIPVLPELIAATTPQRLALSITQATARSAIELDLKDGGFDPETVAQMSLEKVASVDAPYVVWKADVILKSGLGRWLYRVDAFTGTVIAKRSNVQTLQPVSPGVGVPSIGSINRAQAIVTSSRGTNGAAKTTIEKAPTVGTKESLPDRTVIEEQEKKGDPPRQVAPLTGTKDELPTRNEPSRPQPTQK